MAVVPDRNCGLAVSRNTCSLWPYEQRTALEGKTIYQRSSASGGSSGNFISDNQYAISQMTFNI